MHFMAETREGEKEKEIIKKDCFSRINHTLCLLGKLTD